ncbi:MAG: hypothetical protein Q8Q31_01710 [Nanoarchaeota archaeon]|nr:hypothetical protein [Nanoarchaeota archaeon]
MVTEISDKRGWLKAIEVTIAILMILGFVLYLTIDKSRNETQSSVRRDFSQIIYPFLDSVAKNNTLRSQILIANEGEHKPLSSNISLDLQPFASNEGFDFYLAITNSANKTSLGQSGLRSYEGKEVYYYERLLFSDSSVSDFKAKKISLFVWRR